MKQLIIMASLLYSGSCLPLGSSEFDLDFVTFNDGDELFPFHYPKNLVKKLVLPNSLLKRGLSHESAVTDAIDAISRELNVPRLDLNVSSSYRDSFGIDHIFVNHLINRVPITNHNAAVHLKNGRVISFSSSFSGNPADWPKPIPVITLDDAVAIAERKYGAKKNYVEPNLTYLETKSGEIALVYKFQLRND